jgi:hypothetical protein
MKKTQKKLALNKETVRNLATPGLRRAAGGAPTTNHIEFTMAYTCTNDTSQTTGYCPGGDPSVTCVYTQLCNSNEIACIEP